MHIKQSGMVHIKLPFQSLDDISFEGTYAPFADALVATLKDHLANNQEPQYDQPAIESSSSNDESDGEDDSNDEQAPVSELHKVVNKYTVDKVKQLLPDPNKLIVKDTF